MAVGDEGTPGKSRQHLLIDRVAITTVSLAGILVLVGSAHDAPAALQVSLYIAAAAVLAATSHKRSSKSILRPLDMPFVR